MAGTLDFPTFKRSIIKELIKERIDPYLFELSYDYVGDLSETIALLWSDEHSNVTAKLPELAEFIHVFNTIEPTQIPIYLASLLNSANATG